ncbi:MAG TPA: hypothetical protein VNK89_12290 [Thermoflexus sp.]|nr:hypothetical protein [Thermoflexus sp.]
MRSHSFPLAAAQRSMKGFDLLACHADHGAEQVEIAGNANGWR